MEEKRRYKRIVRPLNMRFSFSHQRPPQWQLALFIENISAGGVRFIAPGDLKDKVINLAIESPRWSRRTLELEATVLESKPSEYPSFFDVRAQFINVSEENKKDLLLLENEQR